jgi:hypothetical protein
LIRNWDEDPAQDQLIPFIIVQQDAVITQGHQLGLQNDIPAIKRKLQDIGKKKTHCTPYEIRYNQVLEPSPNALAVRSIIVSSIQPTRNRKEQGNKKTEQPIREQVLNKTGYSQLLSNNRKRLEIPKV